MTVVDRHLQRILQPRNAAKAWWQDKAPLRQQKLDDVEVALRAGDLKKPNVAVAGHPAHVRARAEQPSDDGDMAVPTRHEQRCLEPLCVVVIVVVVVVAAADEANVAAAAAAREQAPRPLAVPPRPLWAAPFGSRRG